MAHTSKVAKSKYSMLFLHATKDELDIIVLKAFPGLRQCQQRKTLWEVEKGLKPNVSWFKPFGCHATVYVGDNKKQLWHGSSLRGGLHAS